MSTAQLHNFHRHRTNLRHRPLCTSASPARATKIRTHRPGTQGSPGRVQRPAPGRPTPQQRHPPRRNPRSRLPQNLRRQDRRPAVPFPGRRASAQHASPTSRAIDQSLRRPAEDDQIGAHRSRRLYRDAARPRANRGEHRQPHQFRRPPPGPRSTNSSSPSMLGGIRLRIGDQIIDGSAATQLRENARKRRVRRQAARNASGSAYHGITHANANLVIGNDAVISN